MNDDDYGYVRTAQVYRLYDEVGRLLYIGHTQSLESRMVIHAATKPWWNLVARREADEELPLLQARTAEREAIAAERPLLNIQSNPSYTGSHADKAKQVQDVLEVLGEDYIRRHWDEWEPIRESLRARGHEVSSTYEAPEWAPADWVEHGPTDTTSAVA